MKLTSAGRSIADCGIRESTGCSVVAVRTERGMEVVPSALITLAADAEMVLIGTAAAEERFLATYADRDTAKEKDGASS